MPHCARIKHEVSNETMIAASRTVRKHARELLAVMVAILFLFVPMAEAARVECGSHTASSEHVVSSQANTDLHIEIEPGGPKACCKSICNLCYALLPAPVLVEFTLKSGGRRDLNPQPPIDGIISRPAIGPPRSAG